MVIVFDLLLGHSNAGSWRFLPLKESLVVFGLPLVFEPVNELHERSKILLVEVETFWSHLDELFRDSLTRHISKHYMLLILGQYGKSVRDSAFV
jgi:hypothetical protein